jgi:hypothetical protein
MLETIYMEDLFIILFLLFLVSTILVFIKPSKFLKNKTEPEKKKTKIALVILTVLFFVLFGMTSDASKSNNKSNVQTASKQSQNIEVEKSTSPTVKKTDQQILEENLSNIVSSAGDMSYRSLQIEKSDPDRPQDTKMITVSVNVKSFWNKSSLLHGTGKLSSSLFKAVYDVPSLKAYDVFVWYRGETTDKYGNKKDDVIISYSIDRVTYDKINWQNFDQSNLCDFLKQEAKATGTFDTACNVLVNLQ